MTIFIIAFSIFSIALLGMAVGVMLGRKPIAGSCGGISNIPGIKRVCDCENPCEAKQLVLEAQRNGKLQEPLDPPVQ